jgi:fanconi anemia group J protein
MTRAQVVKELKNTAYRPTMAVLGAKQHYCIADGVKEKWNIDEECEAKLATKAGCQYKEATLSLVHSVRTRPEVKVRSAFTTADA